MTLAEITELLRRIKSGSSDAEFKLLEFFKSQPIWRSLKDDPPGPEHRMFFVGNSEGGRRDYVFRWPHPKTGEITFWCKGEEVNYVLEHFNPDVWHPGPPNIPGSWVDDLQKGKIQFKKPGFQ